MTTGIQDTSLQDRANVPPEPSCKLTVEITTDEICPVYEDIIQVRLADGMLILNNGNTETPFDMMIVKAFDIKPGCQTC